VAVFRYPLRKTFLERNPKVCHMRHLLPPQTASPLAGINHNQLL